MSTRRLSGDGLGTPLQRSLGLRWLPAPDRPESVVVGMDVNPEVCGPSGTLEGGVISTLIDVAGASAAARALDTTRIVTQHMAVSFLAPGRTGPVEATGTPVRVGRDHAVCEVRVVDVGHAERLMAVALITLRSLS